MADETLTDAADRICDRLEALVDKITEVLDQPRRIEATTVHPDDVVIVNYDRPIGGRVLADLERQWNDQLPCRVVVGGDGAEIAAVIRKSDSPYPRLDRGDLDDEGGEP